MHILRPISLITLLLAMTTTPAIAADFDCSQLVKLVATQSDQIQQLTEEIASLRQTLELKHGQAIAGNSAVKEAMRKQVVVALTNEERPMVVVFRNGHYYPGKPTMIGVLESDPPKSIIKDYFSGKESPMPVTKIVLGRSLTNADYQMEVLDDSKWQPLQEFLFTDGRFHGKADNKASWHRYTANVVRFRLKNAND